MENDFVTLKDEGYDFIQLWRDHTVVNTYTGTVYSQKSNSRHVIIWYHGKSVNLPIDILWRKYFANEIEEYPPERKCDLSKFGYDGYIITDDGKVWNKHLYRWQSTYVRTTTGYVFVGLVNKDGLLANESVHRLVAKAFIPNNYPDKDEVNHLDGDKTNNNVGNLEWSDTYDNGHHARETGLRRRTLTDEDVHSFCREWVTGKYKTAGKCARSLGLKVTACEHIVNHGSHRKISGLYGIPYKKPVRLTPVNWKLYPKSKYLKRPTTQRCDVRTPSNCEKKLIPNSPQT